MVAKKHIISMLQKDRIHYSFLVSQHKHYKQNQFITAYERP